ncbi:MAG: Fic family protein [Nitrospinae bacterium]|nr:Fic family protein [Nitrospinota bacterium]
MKALEKPPTVRNWEENNFQEAIQLFYSDKIKPLIREANKKYVYWDKFKYLKIPERVDPRTAWFCLKMSRSIQTRPIPAKDKRGQPFNFWLPDQVMENLHFIDSFAGGQIALDEPVPNKELKEKYLMRSLIEEAISSSLLEGAATTRKKAKELLISGKKPVSHAEKMIFNNYTTVKKLSSFKDRPLSIELLNSIHRSITEGTLKDPETSGRFRTSDDEPIVVQDFQGNTLFEPPPAGEVEPMALALIEFANQNQVPGEFIHPVIKAIILHFWLAYIHPFVDGNGRTARALFYWHLLKNNYWLMEYLSISSIFLKAPVQYARSFLYSEIDDRDLTYFIVYNLRVIRTAIDNLKFYIARKQKEVRLFDENLRGYPELNSRQSALLKHACRHPNFFYSIKNHQIRHGVTYQTARTDLLDLAKKKLMEKIKKGKTFYFILSKNFERGVAE